MKKVKFSDDIQVLDFYKDKPVIYISNNNNTNINSNPNFNPSPNPSPNNKSIENTDFLEYNRIIDIVSKSSLIILSGILITFLIKRKM